MKTFVLTTYETRRRAERSAMSEALRRALSPRRATRRSNTNKKSLCRDALHRV